MKKILLIYNESDKKEYAEFLTLLVQHKNWKNFIIEQLELQNTGYTAIARTKISESEADILISLNMAGFEYKTLLDNYLYNIIPVRQMHLILNKDVWEQYKTAEFAINLFVYAPHKESDIIVCEEEYFNRRYYSEQLLELKSQMIDCILKDFMQVAKIK